MPTTLEKERQLQGEIASQVEHDLPGVDVLAVELLTPSRFRVYVDHADGVDHALCGRVTDVLRDYLREYSVEVSSPGPTARCAGKSTSRRLSAARSGSARPGGESCAVRSSPPATKRDRGRLRRLRDRDSVPGDRASKSD